MQMYVCHFRITGINTDDEMQLDEDQLKEKKKQKLMKAGFDARERTRREKEREREEREAEEKREEEERDRDLGSWAGRVRKEHEVSLHRPLVVCTHCWNLDGQTIMNRIKERSRRKVALNDRKSAAAQARMKSIANLAADERVPKKRRKVGGG